MPKTVTKVVYKPGTQTTDEYMIIVNPTELKKWKAGGELPVTGSQRVADSSPLEDTSIPLAEVVDSFEIFHSSQGVQGYLGRPSKQQLENTFGTSKDVEVVKIMLEKGKEQAGEGFHAGTFSMNATRGSAILDSKGKGLTGI